MIQRFVLFTMAFTVAVSLVACEESLTDSNSENTPPIPDGEGTPFVEFAGSQEGTAIRGGDPVSFSVEPGEAVGEPITVNYQISGPASSGTDFELLSPNPITIPFDTSTTDIDAAAIQIAGVCGDDVDTPRALNVTLTSAETESGQNVEIGRGGTVQDTVASATILPTAASVSAPDSVAFDTTGVGMSTRDTLAVTNAAGLCSSEISNLAIGGDDADQFTLVSPTSATTLDSGNVLPVVIDFEPTTSGTKGAEFSFQATNDAPPFVNPPTTQDTVSLGGVGPAVQ